MGRQYVYKPKEKGLRKLTTPQLHRVRRNGIIVRETVRWQPDD